MAAISIHSFVGIQKLGIFLVAIGRERGADKSLVSMLGYEALTQTS